MVRETLVHDEYFAERVSTIFASLPFQVYLLVQSMKTTVNKTKKRKKDKL